MKTCGYCGSEIQEPYCSFCEMELDPQHVLENNKRVDHLIDSTPDETAVFLPTKELLTFETIELLFILKYARKHRSDVYNLRIMGHKASAELENDEGMNEIQAQSFAEYEKATRKVWCIENIIKDRIGYYPVKISDDFLQRYLYRIKKSQEKAMAMQSKRKVKS